MWSTRNVSIVENVSVNKNKSESVVNAPKCKRGKQRRAGVRITNTIAVRRWRNVWVWVGNGNVGTVPVSYGNRCR